MPNDGLKRDRLEPIRACNAAGGAVVGGGADLVCATGVAGADACVSAAIRACRLRNRSA